jgi:hypothetical protein
MDNIDSTTAGHLLTMDHEAQAQALLIDTLRDHTQKYKRDAEESAMARFSIL